MASFMGRTGAGAGAAGRALSPLRSRLGSPGSRNILLTRKQHKKYLSMSHLRSLYSELVATLEDASAAGTAGTAAAAAPPPPDAAPPPPPPAAAASATSPVPGVDAAKVAKQELRLVEILRSIAELVAFGEAAEEPEYFEFFCEKAILALFVEALRLGPAIKTQVVQAISILLQNLRSPLSLYMLLSQDHINRLIQPDAGVAELELPLDDEEFLTNYVALLKAISVRLSKDTVQFFLNTAKGSFPLFSRAVPLIAHADPMVRTSALNIALHVFSVKDPGVAAFLTLEENHGSFFGQVSRLLHDAYSQILCRMWQAREPSAATDAMDGATSFFQDMLYYVQDVLDAGGPWLSYRLATHLHVMFFRPVVLEGLAGALNAGACGNNNNDNDDDDNNKGNNKSSSKDSTNGELVKGGREVAAEHELEVQLALYALCQVFAVMTDGPLLAAVAADLFSFGCVAGGSGGGSVGVGVGVGAGIGGVGGVGAGVGCDGSGDGGGCGGDGGRGSGSGEPVAAATELAGSASVVAEAEESEGETRSRPVASSGASDRQGRDRYCRALAACVARRRAGGGAQTRLGAVALVRSAIVNPTVGKAILRGGTPSGSTLSPARFKAGCDNTDIDACASGDGGETARYGAAAADVAGIGYGTTIAIAADAVNGTSHPKERSRETVAIFDDLVRVLPDPTPDSPLPLPPPPPPPPPGASGETVVVTPPRQTSCAGEEEEGKRWRGQEKEEGEGEEGEGRGWRGAERDHDENRTRYRPGSKVFEDDDDDEFDAVFLRDDREGAVRREGLPAVGGGIAGAGAGKGSGGAAAIGPDSMLPGFKERGGEEGAGGGGGGGGGDTGLFSIDGGSALRPSPRGNGTHCSTRGQERNARFEQVMMILLEALTGPPPPSSAATVRTAAAAVGEFWLLEQSSSRGGPRISRGSGADHSGGHADGGIIGGGGVGGVGVSGGFGGGGGGGDGGGGGVGGVGVGVGGINGVGGGGGGGCRGGGGGGGGDSGAICGPSGDLLWAPGTRYHRIGKMLTEAYAQSAATLLSTTPRRQPFALLSACEEAVELLGVGVGAALCASSPPPPLSEVAGSRWLLGEGEAAAGGGDVVVGVGVGGGGRGGGGGGGGEAGELVLRAQTFLVLRSLHRWLVEGAWSPPPVNLAATTSPAAATADAHLAPRDPPDETAARRSDPPPLPLPPPVGTRVDPVFLALIAGRAAYPVHEHNNGGDHGGSGSGGGGGGGGGSGGGGGGGSGGRGISPSHSNGGWSSWVLSEARRGPAPLTNAPAAASGGVVVETATPLTPSSSPLPLPLSPPPAPTPTTMPPPPLLPPTPPLSPAVLSEPRLGGRVRLSGRRCVACCLPVDWPGATILPANTSSSASASANADANGVATTTVNNGGGGGSGGSSNTGTGRGYYRRGPSPPPPPNLHLVELYVVLDERSFLLAVPDPESPMDGGIIVSVAPLRNACAKSHPANPRVAELRVSTREEGRVVVGEEPGLFLPIAPGGASSGASRGGRDGGGGGDGGASFRGVGHKGIWNLVLTFESKSACNLVEEHVEEQREAALAALTVEMVETFRRIASLGGGGSGGGGGENSFEDDDDAQAHRY